MTRFSTRSSVSIDIMLAIESAGSGASLLPTANADRERVIAELKGFDSAEGVGAAGYTYMRGAPFGESPASGCENLESLQAEFERKLSVLEARLCEHEGPWFEKAFGVLDIALWPIMERQAAGLHAFRGYELRGHPSFPAVSTWLHAMAQRTAVQRVASDDGTLVRLFSRVFGMAGARPSTEDEAAYGYPDAEEASTKLMLNCQAVVSDIVKNAALGAANLTSAEVTQVVDVAVLLVACRLAAVQPPDLTATVLVEKKAAVSATVSAALAFLRARVSAPRDMSARAAIQLRIACAEEAVAAYDRFGY